MATEMKIQGEVWGLPLGVTTSTNITGVYVYRITSDTATMRDSLLIIKRVYQPQIIIVISTLNHTYWSHEPTLNLAILNGGPHCR